MSLILVTRTHPNGNLTIAGFVVDLFCLGVKDAFWRFNQHPLDFKNLLEKQLKEINDEDPLVEVDYNLVHNVIYGAIEFAQELE